MRLPKGLYTIRMLCMNLIATSKILRLVNLLQLDCRLITVQLLLYYNGVPHANAGNTIVCNGKANGLQKS